MYIQDTHSGTILTWSSLEHFLLKLLRTVLHVVVFVPLPSAIAALLVRNAV